ncbi:ribosomal RNA small subunit methyltransferase B [Luminiphilus syltensis NOR5-1B]|uniref:16S rRNA (cytosine(967)-C(5))-methyltransferase n=1 Tax=Luminiphilus syltensis NOR5-1B TaxID=565045 RepID=B8KUF9_9GAMM|nr:ribosomal RNA small subunit methyltransferase B [Luminiphilus syltensis NOR5-1B]
MLNGRSLAAVLPSHLASVDSGQRPLVMELVYSTLREWPLLEGISRQLLRKPLRKKDADVHALVLLGLQQLRGTRIAHHAAVSETVAVCRELRKNWATGLVNGVLRTYQRQTAELIDNLSPAEKAALPEWMYQQLAKEWPHHLTKIAAASSSRPPMSLRINTRLCSPEEYKQRLHAEGIAFSADGLSNTAVTLARPIDVESVPGFTAGQISVQDVSAQLAAILLDAKPGETVLDACAAPGGKSCHIAERQPELKTLIAADIDAKRLEKVIANRDRLGLGFDCIAMDAAHPGDELGVGRFDAIVADVPCSATGVLRRNPDIKIHRGKTDIRHFAQQQTDITHGLWPLLKPGGRLLYVTCSILRAENDAQVEAFLEHHEDAAVEPFDTEVGIATEYGQQVLPAAEGGDGLYFSLIRRAL